MAVRTLGAYTHYLWSFLTGAPSATGVPGTPPDYHYGAPSTTEDKFNPRNYQDDEGQYYRVRVQSGQLRYSRCDFSTPLGVSTGGGWDVDFLIPGITGASFPVVTVEPVRRSVLVMWQHTGPEVLEALSDDDGESWEDPIVAFAGGKYPAIWVGVDSSVMRGAVVGSNIKLTFQAPGDMAPSAPFTMVDETGTPIPVKDDTFGLSQETNDSTLRWTAELSVTGETATSTWESTDEGESWKRVV